MFPWRWSLNLDILLESIATWTSTEPVSVGVLDEIQSGAFAKEWMSQAREGSPFLNEKRAEASKHQLEEVGKGLREMMPFLNAKDVKKDKWVTTN